MATIMISTPGGLVPSTRENWQRYIENKPVPIVRQKIFVGDILKGLRSVVNDWLDDVDDPTDIPIDWAILMTDFCDLLGECGVHDCHERVMGVDLAKRVKKVTG